MRGREKCQTRRACHARHNHATNYDTLAGRKSRRRTQPCDIIVGECDMTPWLGVNKLRVVESKQEKHNKLPVTFYNVITLSHKILNDNNGRNASVFAETQLFVFLVLVIPATRDGSRQHTTQHARASEGFFQGGGITGFLKFFLGGPRWCETKKATFFAEFFKIQGDKAPSIPPPTPMRTRATYQTCVKLFSIFF